MNSFASADWKMMMAMRADLQVLIEFLVIKHRGTFRTLDPKALRNFLFARFGSSELRFFDESAVGIRRGRGDRGFDTFHAKGFFVERGRRHFVSYLDFGVEVGGAARAVENAGLGSLSATAGISIFMGGHCTISGCCGQLSKRRR